MGEIKSTLDIVMEKTKHLTLSDAEKQTRAREDVKNSVKGLIQKYQDMILREERVKNEMDALADTSDVDAELCVFEEIFQRLDLDQDNGRLLGLLNALFGTDTAALAALFDAFQEAVQHLERTSMRDKKKALAEAHFISGSAVVPHLSADAAWQKEAQGLEKRYEALLAGQRSSLRPKSGSVLPED